MAKKIIDNNAVPVAAPPAAPATPVMANAGTPATLESVSQSMGVPTPPSISVSPQQVYSSQNIASVSNSPAKTPNYSKMSVDKLASTIAKAKNKAELNQVKIMNQPLSMGVITGQAAHMAAINNAQINSLSNIWDAKNTELARKEAEKQRKEDVAFRDKQFALQEKNTLSEIAARGMPKAANVLGTIGSTLQRGEGGFVDYSAYQTAKDKAIKSGTGISGTDFDSAYGSMLSEGDKQKFGIGMTPQQTSQIASGGLTADISNQLISNASQNKDKKADPVLYQQLREQYLRNVPGATIANFDSTFGGMLSPNEQQKLNIQAKPSTQAQIQAAGYGQRLEQSDAALGNLGGWIVKSNPVAFGIAGKLPSWMQSSEMQQYDQASRNFINAVLRRESGAAIAQSEFDNAYQQYLPKPGDSEETLRQKAQNRKTVMQNMEQAAGGAYNQFGQNSGQVSSGDIIVIDRATNQHGTIPASEYDPSKYIIVNE